LCKHGGKRGGNYHLPAEYECVVGQEEA
jgi:hypothetical protein